MKKIYLSIVMFIVALFIVFSKIDKGIYIDSLDYLVATHPHSDHIGGLQTVLNQIEVEFV